MRIEELSIGENPPEDVNVIIEVPVGGQPICLTSAPMEQTSRIS